MEGGSCREQIRLRLDEAARLLAAWPLLSPDDVALVDLAALGDVLTRATELLGSGRAGPRRRLVRLVSPSPPRSAEDEPPRRRRRSPSAESPSPPPRRRRVVTLEDPRDSASGAVDDDVLASIRAEYEMPVFLPPASGRDAASRVFWLDHEQWWSTLPVLGSAAGPAPGEPLLVFCMGTAAAPSTGAEFAWVQAFYTFRDGQEPSYWLTPWRAVVPAAVLRPAGRLVSAVRPPGLDAQLRFGGTDTSDRTAPAPPPRAELQDAELRDETLAPALLETMDLLDCSQNGALFASGGVSLETLVEAVCSGSCAGRSVFDALFRAALTRGQGLSADSAWLKEVVYNPAAYAPLERLRAPLQGPCAACLLPRTLSARLPDGRLLGSECAGCVRSLCAVAERLFTEQALVEYGRRRGSSRSLARFVRGTLSLAK